ncbi:MAG TPA: hypothetical protein VJ418_26705 [Streptosporangiaceae bacterium]|nr:hypothetical protein [Streptosporangiaceae bacterium]
MPKVLVTGMSGTGKSAALQMPGQRGHRVVDTDTDQWSHWVTPPAGSPDWIWREDAIAALLASHKHGHLFVAGCKTNQGKFYPQFDHIALLSAPADIILARIGTRTVSSRESVRMYGHATRCLFRLRSPPWPGLDNYRR